jgi:hypothetical protein
MKKDWMKISKISYADYALYVRLEGGEETITPLSKISFINIHSKDLSLRIGMRDIKILYLAGFDSFPGAQKLIKDFAEYLAKLEFSYTP